MIRKLNSFFFCIHRLVTISKGLSTISADYKQQQFTLQKLRPKVGLCRVYQLMGKFQESLEMLKEVKELNSKHDQPESGGLAITEGRLSATHLLLNNTAKSIEHAKETLMRVGAMIEIDPKNLGKSLFCWCV